jgi:glucosamine-6-phosphate isomerase
MEVKVYSSHEQLSENAANEIIELVKNKPSAVLCLASGETPKLTCQLLVEKARKQNIDFSKVNFIGLDEWVGISPENEGSCHYFFQTQLFNNLNFSDSRKRLFNSLADDLTKECNKMDEAIADLGGLDLMLVGVGMNGHIGFNEPGVSFLNYSHVMDLDSVTTSVGQKYFKENTELKKGITLGIRHLVESKKVLMLANGEKKAKIIKIALQGRMGHLVPASIVQTIPHAIVMLDKEAASLLENDSGCN